jgi:lysyl-tRNA synthetase class 2
MTDQTQNEMESVAVDTFEQREQRIKKLNELVDAGENPFGQAVAGLQSTAQTLEAFEAVQAPEDEEKETPVVEAKIAGRLTAMRVMGKSIFADIKDERGRLQIYVQKNQLGERFAEFKKLDLGDILWVSGEVFRTRMGEVTVKVHEFGLLSKSLRPLPEKWHGLTDIEQRYRQRYLDLIGNDEVRDIFRMRTQVVWEIRRFLNERGFMEVETPMLQSIPGGAAARPFETFYNALDCPMYLRIAPELYLKRLLVGGFEKVYEINRNFRNEGLDRRHNPEFTMIEIYEAYSDCAGMMELVEEMITTVAERVFGTLQFKLGEDQVVDLKRPWRRVAYADLIRERMGDDWHDLDLPAQRDKAREAGLDVTDEMDAVEVTHEVYEKLIERTLIQPTFVTRLPAALVPLAKKCVDAPEVVDVFELEICGQEIAPGYSELNDPVEQRRRFEAQAVKTSGTVEEMSGKMDEDFLVALEHGMPPAGGMGMGIDRLLMLLTGAASIRDVILFPQMRPER